MNSDHLVTLAITLGTSYVCFVIVCWYLYGPLIFNPFELSTLFQKCVLYWILSIVKLTLKPLNTCFSAKSLFTPNDVRLLLSDQAKILSKENKNDIKIFIFPVLWFSVKLLFPDLSHAGEATTPLSL
jgi:hypothetical protein